MKIMHVVAVVALAVQAGCSATSQPINPLVNGCPEVAALTPSAGWEPAEAEYRAQQRGTEITVTATGNNPTPGYQNALGLDPQAKSIPILTNQRKRPSGMVAQVITPYTICGRFNAAGSIKKIEVHDKAGKHVVSVKQVGD